MIESYLETLIMQVDGMHGPRCERSVCSALAAIPGVLAVEVSLETREAIVRYDRGKVWTGQFRTALFAMGFESVRMYGPVAARGPDQPAPVAFTVRETVRAMAIPRE